MQNVLHKASFLSFSNCRFYIRTSCHAMGRVYDNFGKQWTLWGGLQNFRSWLGMYEGDYGQADFILLLRPIRLMLRPALRNLQLCNMHPSVYLQLWIKISFLLWFHPGLLPRYVLCFTITH